MLADAFAFINALIAIRFCLVCGNSLKSSVHVGFSGSISRKKNSFPRVIQKTASAALLPRFGIPFLRFQYAAIWLPDRQDNRGSTHLLLLITHTHTHTHRVRKKKRERDREICVTCSLKTYNEVYKPDKQAIQYSTLTVTLALTHWPLSAESMSYS